MSRLSRVLQRQLEACCTRRGGVLLSRHDLCAQHGTADASRDAARMSGDHKA